MHELEKTKSKASELASLLVENEEIIQNLVNSMLSDFFEGKMRTQKAGIGDEFFQYRPLNDGEGANRIDWRMSAKSDNLMVKEKQVLIPNQLAIWLDLSAQMDFKSNGVNYAKDEIGLIYAQALEMALKKLGAIIAVCGQKFGAGFTQRLLIAGNNFPNNFRQIPNIIISDGLRPIEFWEKFLANAKHYNALIFLFIINDKQELDFDFKGNIEFHEFENQNVNIEIDDCELVQDDYKLQIAAHFSQLQALLKYHHFGYFFGRNDGDIEKQIIAMWHELNLFLRQWQK